MQRRIRHAAGRVVRGTARSALIGLVTVGLIGAVAAAPAQASAIGTVSALPASPALSAGAEEVPGAASLAAREANLSPQDSGANFSVNIDVLGIAQAIANAVNANNNRGGWVKGVMETAFFQAGQRYNVMVFNLNQEYQHQFNGVVFFATAQYTGITYGIWAFKTGSFDNKGDGGWINWAFQGWFKRNGGHVDFSNPNF